MSPLPPDLKDELQKEYAASFDDKIAELENALKTLDVKKLENAFHKLAGSGKTYEMDEISDIARQCETLLKGAFQEDKIKAGVQKLKQLFKQEKSRLKL